MDFTGFMTGLLAEGFVSLGVMKNPVTGEARKDLRHAGLVIDTIDMLREKTKGNLSKEESDTLEESLHQLRVMFVQAVGEAGLEDKEKGKRKKEKDTGQDSGQTSDVKGQTTGGVSEGQQSSPKPESGEGGSVGGSEKEETTKESKDKEKSEE